MAATSKEHKCFKTDLRYKLCETIQNGFLTQMAGFVERDQGLKFTTIRGAEHMTPTDKPGPVLKVTVELIGKSKLN
jgi:hypothetical protein